MTLRRRETGLFVFAAAIVGASLLTETKRDVGAAAPVLAPSVTSRGSLQSRSEVAILDVDEWLGRLKARNMNPGLGGQGLFGSTTWQPPQAPATQPSKPQTPPFPFRLLGRMTLGGSTVIILSKGEQTYPVKPGDVIEQFRIDRIDDDAMRVTYLPTGEDKDYRNEDLYPSLAAAAFPSAPPAPQPVETTAPAPLPKQASSPLPQQAPASPPVQVGGAAAGAGQIPLNQMPGASAPIGGMTIPAPGGIGMVIVPSPPGAGMVIAPPPPGIVMPGVPASALGSSPAPGSQ